MDVTGIVREHYNLNVEGEWNRIENRPEFLITKRFLQKHIKPGDKVLDIGGGPGRYSVWLAQMGCDVTLLDLSGENVRFAREKAKEYGVSIKAIEGNACNADGCIKDELDAQRFDHVLLMGPLYHLLEEAQRVQAVNAALNCLKPGGTFFASFIVMFAGMIYAMKYDPAVIIERGEEKFMQMVIDDKSYAGMAFTQAFFISQKEILPFMEKFPLEKLYLFGQESILSPCEGNIFAQSKEVLAAWLDVAEKLATREELLSFSEHLMYVGKKL